MPLEGPNIGRQQAETNRATAVTVIDAVDQRRQLLVLVIRPEQIRLMLRGRNEVEQDDTDGQWLVSRHLGPKLVEAAKQKSGVAGPGEIDLAPPASEIGEP